MRNAVVGFAAAVLLLLLFLAFGCARAEEGKDRQVKITGSDTMVVLVQALAEEYMRENPQKRISVSGGGSGVGIAALQSKSTDIAMSSRDMKASEIEAAKANGVFPKRIAIAYDGISIFVHPSNPVNELSVEQLRAIFKGEIKNWKEVGGPDAPISPYSRESSSGTYDFVKEHVLGGADYAPNTKYIAGSALLVESVSQDKTGIGYTGVAYTRQDNRVKILAIGKEGEKFLPTKENIKAGKYYLGRELLFYTDGEPQGAAKEFIDFVLGQKGQSIVEKVGYFPA